MSYALQELLNQELHQRSGRTLWIVDENVQRADLQALTAGNDLLALTNRCDTHTALDAAGVQALLNDFDFSSWPPGTFNTVIYRVSKERAVVHHCINQAHTVLTIGGQLILLGGKQDGIKTNAKNAAQVFGSKEKIKKHGVFYRASITKTHTSPFSLLDSQQYAQLRLCQSDGLEFMSKPGLFGWNKVDRGSQLLVEQLRELLCTSAEIPIPCLPSVLDLGCGYGYLLLTTADLPFSARTATDNNAAAVHAAQVNFVRKDLSVNVLLDDCGGKLQERFDLILCNPPFHLGFAASRDLTEKFLRQIQRLLSSQGVALLVVNQFIPLETLAREWFGGVNLIGSCAGYKVVALHRA